MINYINEIKKILDEKEIRYEINSFDSGAYMIDVSTINIFYCLQIFKNEFGITNVTKNPDFCTIPEKTYNNWNDFIIELKNIVNKINQQITLKDNRKLGFAEYGDKNGFPIIYYHGSQSSRLEMHYDTSFAEENNLRIITIDRSGHGSSDFNSKGTILGFGEDVMQLIEHLKINKFSVVGMSAGSPFALGISHLFPDRIYKTSIISGFAPFNKESKKHLSKEVKVMLNLAKSFPFLLKLLLKIQTKKLAENPKKALQGFLKIMSEPDQKILKNNSIMEIIEIMFQEAFRNGSEGVAYEISKLLVKDWNFELKDIKVPVTFWQGNKDNNVPYKWAELMKNEIPNATLNTFSDEGHLIIFEHAKEIFTELKENNL